MNRNLITISPVWQWIWVVPAFVGAGLTGLTLFVLPPDRVVSGISDFLFKLSPLILAVLAIALFPRKGSWTGLLLVAGFIFYMGYIDSAYFLQITRLIDAAIANTYKEQFPAFYTFNVFVNSFTILLAVFAYRLGGASSARVLKVGLSGILIMISGLNDITMWVMYPWPDGQRPAVFSWASHVAIFIGGISPNLYQMLAFLCVHLVLIGVIFWLPLDKWISKLSERLHSGEISSRNVAEPSAQE